MSCHINETPDLVAHIKGKFLATGAFDLNVSNSGDEDVESKPERRRKVETEIARRCRECCTRAESEEMGAKSK